MIKTTLALFLILFVIRTNGLTCIDPNCATCDQVTA